MKSFLPFLAFRIALLSIAVFCAWFTVSGQDLFSNQANTILQIQVGPRWVGGQVYVEKQPVPMMNVQEQFTNSVPQNGLVYINLGDNRQHTIRVGKKFSQQGALTFSDSRSAMASALKMNKRPLRLGWENEGYRVQIVNNRTNTAWVSIDRKSPVPVAAAQSKNFEFYDDSPRQIRATELESGGEVYLQRSVNKRDAGNSIRIQGGKKKKKTEFPTEAFVVIFIVGIVGVFGFVFWKIVSGEPMKRKPQGTPAATPPQAFAAKSARKARKYQKTQWLDVEQSIEQILHTQSNRGLQPIHHLPDHLQSLRNEYSSFAPIGEGGVAEVYRVKTMDKKHDRILKVLKPNHSHASNPIQSLFVHEYRVLDYLRAHGVHPQVMRMSPYPAPDNQAVWFEMELLDPRYWVTLEDLQESFASYRNDGRIPGKYALKLMRNISAAVHKMHTRRDHPVIHGDLTPSNIMVSLTSFGDYVRIIDFGTAHCSGTKEYFPSDDVSQDTMGKPSYYPEEQASAGVKGIGAEGDWYSIGITFWRMLSYSLPYAKREDHRRGGLSPDLLVQQATGINRRHAAMIVRMFDPDPRKRPTGHEICRSF